jgi:hypothetical protein
VKGFYIKPNVPETEHCHGLALRVVADFDAHDPDRAAYWTLSPLVVPSVGDTVIFNDGPAVVAEVVWFPTGMAPGETGGTVVVDVRCTRKP